MIRWWLNQNLYEDILVQKKYIVFSMLMLVNFFSGKTWWNGWRHKASNSLYGERGILLCFEGFHCPIWSPFVGMLLSFWPIILPYSTSFSCMNCLYLACYILNSSSLVRHNNPKKSLSLHRARKGLLLNWERNLMLPIQNMENFFCKSTPTSQLNW